ncbi:hypothetical protein D3C84_925580 [compost metagenome]
MLLLVRQLLNLPLLAFLVRFQHKLRIEIEHFGKRQHNSRPVRWLRLLDSFRRQIQVQHVGAEVPVRRQSDTGMNASNMNTPLDERLVN